MIPLLLRKFNELTNNEFDYIKLTEVNVYVKSQRIEVFLIYPEEKRSEVVSATKKIILSIKSVIASDTEGYTLKNSKNPFLKKSRSK